MSETYFSVEQIAQMLHIHKKTIQRYIREGKIRATKIGKSWRVSGHDLTRFTEGHSKDTEESSSDHPVKERTKASSVIDIQVSGKDEAMRIINTITAVMNVKPREIGQASMHSQFMEQDNMVRMTLWGSVQFLSVMVSTLETLIEEYSV
jgi:excisionase family DNA binding protein